MVVDVAEDSAGTDTVGAILGIDELAETVHDHSAVLPLALLLVLLGLNSRQRHTTQHIALANELTGMAAQLTARHCIHVNTHAYRYTSTVHPTLADFSSFRSL